MVPAKNGWMRVRTFRFGSTRKVPAGEALVGTGAGADADDGAAAGAQPMPYESTPAGATSSTRPDAALIRKAVGASHFPDH